MKVHHIGYLVNQIDAAVTKFETQGFQIEVEKFYVEDRKQWNVFMKNDHTRLELIQSDIKDADGTKNAGVGGMASALVGGVGPYHICYESDCFEEDIKKLRKGGFLPISKVEREPAIHNGRLQFFYSSQVGIVEIMESKP